MLVGMAHFSEQSMIAAALSTGTFKDWGSRRNDPDFSKEDTQAEFDDWVDGILESAEDYELQTSAMTAEDYGLQAPANEYIDPILAVIVNARLQRDHAERVLKLGIAYARSCERPYSLRTIAECAKMAPSTVASYFNTSDQVTAHAIVLEVRNALPALFSRVTEE